MACIPFVIDKLQKKFYPLLRWREKDDISWTVLEVDLELFWGVSWWRGDTLSLQRLHFSLLSLLPSSVERLTDSNLVDVSTSSKEEVTFDVLKEVVGPFWKVDARKNILTTSSVSVFLLKNLWLLKNRSTEIKTVLRVRKDLQRKIWKEIFERQDSWKEIWRHHRQCWLCHWFLLRNKEREKNES